MKLNYREETARMLKTLRKAGYDNELLRREKYLADCVAKENLTLQRSEEPLGQLSGCMVKYTTLQELLDQAFSLGYKPDNLYVHMEDCEDDYNSGVSYVQLMHKLPVSDLVYFHQIQQHFRDAKLATVQEAMKQDVESLLGCKITAYTLNQLKSTLDKHNNKQESD